jgi:nitrite reductase (NADH) small subunit
MISYFSSWEYIRERAMSSIGNKVVMTDDWLEVGRVEEIPSLGARVVRTAEGDVAVFRAGDGVLFALADRCPHKGGPLSQGIVYGHTVACPLHNWCIELASGCAVAPDQGTTRSYPVKVEEGVVYLNLCRT